MRASSYRYSADGDTIRVVIAGDVIALPDEGWSCGNFGRHISAEWLLTQPRPKIPGTARRPAAGVGSGMVRRRFDMGCFRGRPVVQMLIERAEAQEDGSIRIAGREAP